ncbi:MAG: SOSS complex subunit B family protein [Nanobdellota archaeon]
MKIADLQPKQKDVDLIVNVEDKGEVKEFEKYGKKGKVCKALINDDSGRINLTLWDHDTKRINKGDRLHIKKGYVNEFKGEKEITSGKFGMIEKLGEEDEVERGMEELKKEDKELNELEKVEDLEEDDIVSIDDLEERK